MASRSSRKLLTPQFTGGSPPRAREGRDQEKVQRAIKKLVSIHAPKRSKMPNQFPS